jgi:hypothetical protein
VNADTWPRVKEVFHAALERDVQERPAYIAGACANDPALRAEVERLLIAHETAGGFIEQAPAVAASPARR